MTERAVSFGKASQLVGVVTPPKDAANGWGVIFLSSGLLHRVGPHRLYVVMARLLAEHGFTSLRFDLSGIGDSSPRRDTLPVEQSGVAEAREAIDLLEAEGCERFLAVGLCGGGYFAFRTAGADPRVEAAALLNVRGHLHGTDPETGDALRQGSMRRHYMRLATSSSFRSKNWRKIFSGRVDIRSALKSLLKGRDRPTQLPGPGELDALHQRGVKLLHLYSEGDEGLDYLHVVLGRQLAPLRRDGSHFELIRGCNHTFTPLWSQQKMLEILTTWASGLSHS